MGVGCLHDQPGWQASVLRLLAVFVDGPVRKPNTTSGRNTNGMIR
jgi:hypothetical protein